MRARLAWTLVACGLCAAAGARADLLVREVAMELTDTALVASTEIRLALGAQVEEALLSGVELKFDIHHELRRKSRYWRDERLAQRVLARRLRFHALTRRLVLSSDEGEAVTYRALDDALAELGRIEALELPLPEHQPLPADGEYVLRVRIALDIEALPPPLRPVAYTSPAWYLDSGWSVWALRR